MHLDTVLTRVDVNKFTVHSQVMQITKVFEITKSNSDELKIKELENWRERRKNITRGYGKIHTRI